MSADRRPHRVLHLIPSDAIGGVEMAAHSLPAGLGGDNAILDDPGNAGAIAHAVVGAWVGVRLSKTGRQCSYRAGRQDLRADPHRLQLHDWRQRGGHDAAQEGR